MKPFRLVFFYLIVIVISAALFLAAGEIIVRMAQKKTYYEGKAGSWAKHDVLGWVPSPGKATITSEEFKAVINVNTFGMNGGPLEESVDIAKTKIMVLGDSHTFAAGVSTEEAWPKVLEKMLFRGDIKQGAVYNCAVTGYSLGQYLLRMRQLEGILNPGIIIIGLSMATDFYDLMPPRLGGFVYGANFGRVYFDLDAQGELIECDDLKGKDLNAAGAEPGNKKQLSLSRRTYFFLRDHSALCRRLSRSKLAMWLFMRVNPNLWPGMDTVLKKELGPEDEYRWRLGRQIIEKIAQEAHQKGRVVLLVNLPYLAQVYDEVWQSSFGMRPEKYDRWISGERLKNICAKAGIFYIDTTPDFIEEVKRNKRWLHYKSDGHPTAEGHKIIAKEIYEAYCNFNGL